MASYTEDQQAIWYPSGLAEVLDLGSSARNNVRKAGGKDKVHACF
jgi:hypothetical protein